MHRPARKAGPRRQFRRDVVEALRRRGAHAQERWDSIVVTGRFYSTVFVLMGREQDGQYRCERYTWQAGPQKHGDDIRSTFPPTADAVAAMLARHLDPDDCRLPPEGPEAK